MIADPTIPALFVAGLAGGVHCAGMCGGLVAAMSGPTARPAPAPAPSALALRSRAVTIPVVAAPSHALDRGQASLLAFNAGRVTSYTVAGAIAGAIGSLGWIISHLLPIQQAGFVFTNLALLVLGLSLAGGPVGRLIDDAAARLFGGPWRRIRGRVVRPFAAHPVGGAFATGLAWGWVPCAMVYTALLSALSSGDPLRGAAMMAAFGAGTLPNLIGLGLVARSARGAGARRWFRPLAAALLIVFALAGLARIDPIAHVLAFAESCLTPLRLH